MRHGSLFSGIGGFDLAAEWMGWENVFHCEWNEFGQKVLKYYWPRAESFTDITKTDFSKYAGTIDLISGGFPCQPYSQAGKRLGKEDDRHLWPEMLRAIREIKPDWVVGENVYGLVNWNGGLVFHEVQADLEAQGYEVWPFLLPAASVGAPHMRDRVWFIAHASSVGRRENAVGGAQSIFPKKNEMEPQGKPEGERKQRKTTNTQDSKFKQPRGFWDRFPIEPPICVGNDGLPVGLDGITIPKWRGETIKAAGNAVCPPLVFNIFRAIGEYEKKIRLS